MIYVYCDEVVIGCDGFFWFGLRFNVCGVGG